MGMVKVDIHKAERPYEQITFSDVSCIKGLIKLRNKLDGFTDAGHVTSENWTDIIGNTNQIGYASDCVSGVNQELIAVFVTLDGYIEKANLNIKQRNIISGLMSGYTEQDCAESWKTDVRNIASILDTVANKIKDINDLEWKYNFIFLNKKKVSDKGGFSFKKCGTCNDRKPANRDFFSRDNRNEDALSNRCKGCDLRRKQGSKAE